MAELINEIPKDKYSRELQIEVLKISRTATVIEEIDHLFKLVHCELTGDALRKLVKSADFILPEIETENIEILARVNDAKFILGDKDKLNCIRKAVEQYLEVFNGINDLDYFVRALELVRKVKSVFEPKLQEFEEKTLQAIPKLESSYYQLKLIEASFFLIQESSLKTLADYFLAQLDQSFEGNEYRDASNYIKALNRLGHFDNNECKIQTALCLERKADHHVSQKEPNTYYPNILPIYVEALKEIKGVIVDEEFKTRLQKKIKTEQRIHVEMLGKIGVSGQSQLDIPELVANLNVIDFKSGLTALIQLPIIEFELLKSLNEKTDKKFLWRQFFGEIIHITSKGTVSGTSDIEDYDVNFFRNHFRDMIIAMAREIKYIMDFDRQISKDLIAEMVIRCESPFIPKDREHLFIEGIYCGFQNNFILASHLLIPQIENSLKHIIELNGRNATKLAEEIQNDNTLGSILGTEENGKMLDGICDRDLLLELNSFLVDGNSTNFRNRICHGLTSPFETNYYGIYLWWLVLKMIKQTSNYFKISET